MGMKGMPKQLLGRANLAVVFLVKRRHHLGENTTLIKSTVARNVDIITPIAYVQQASVLLALQDGTTIIRKHRFVKLALWVIRIRAAATAKTAMHVALHPATLAKQDPTVKLGMEWILITVLLQQGVAKKTLKAKMNAEWLTVG